MTARKDREQAVAEGTSRAMSNEATELRVPANLLDQPMRVKCFVPKTGKVYDSGQASHSNWFLRWLDGRIQSNPTSIYFLVAETTDVFEPERDFNEYAWLVEHTADPVVSREAVIRAVGDEAEHVCRPGPLCSAWPFSDDDAMRTIAAVSWPGEREENRDAWAATMRHRPDLLETEIAQARERLKGAIAHARRAALAGPDTGREGKA